MAYGTILIGFNFFIWYAHTFLLKKKSAIYTDYPLFVLIGLCLTYYVPYFIFKDYQNGEMVIFELTVFYVSFIVLHILIKKRAKNKFIYTTPVNLAKIYLGTICLWIFSLASGLDNPLLILDRALNPRDYTHIRSSEGIITFISIGFTFCSTYLSACEFIREKNLRKFLIFLIFVAINLLGGGKSSMVSIILILIFAKETVSGQSVSGYSFIKYGIIALIALILSFGLFSRAGSRTSDVGEMLSRFVEYQQEYIFSTLLYTNANSKAGDYFLVGIYETLSAGVPRGVFPSKPQGALYTKYINPELDISDDINHFATYGIQLEGKLVFGWLWPIIAAFILVLYLKIPEYLSRHHETPRIFILWNCLIIFGFIRAGVLFTTPWMTFIIIPLIYILMGGRKYIISSRAA